jgi:hypothetical protein
MFTCLALFRILLLLLVALEGIKMKQQDVAAVHSKKGLRPFFLPKHALDQIRTI